MATKNPPKVEQQAPAFNPFNHPHEPAAPAVPSLETAFDLTPEVARGVVEEPSHGHKVDLIVEEQVGQFDEAAFRAIMSGQGLGNTKVNKPDGTQRNPFARPVPPPVVEKAPVEDITRPEGTPTWRDFAAFVCKHGQTIIAAIYPYPQGSCVDTLWRGVPVVHGPATEVRHITEGWISWDIASSEE